MVTGASRGLGLQIVKSLVNGSFSPGKIIARLRHETRAEPRCGQQGQYSLRNAAQEVHVIVQDEGPNYLINNVVINFVADFQTVTAEKMLQNFHTNTVGPLMLTKALLPALRAARGGSGMGVHRPAVLNISSCLGSVVLNWGDSANKFKWYPYRTSKWRSGVTDLTVEEQQADIMA
ncbi:hypothetical protein SKAU_G00307770 [Synaphobranchus kaupii]|uniref:Uncharacterized protein n=1 Tax=Synaphobranchus kaupii TaxID=118154 RepID=A0A9Q1ER38_SYNKA|nr:hypothetical protein SKAU_G00307770 [Synaphobranchus kaupii]